MTRLGRILRFTEYWNHNHVRDEEMTNEMKVEIKRAQRDAFVAAMEYNRDPSGPDFEDFYEKDLITEVKW